MKCRCCQNLLKHIFVDLGYSPLSNAFLRQQEIEGGVGETFYPLKVWFCDKCFLVQLDEFKKSSEIFNEDYVYFSSYSKSWLAHARDYVEKVTQRLGLNMQSFVVEVASNDGYLLQYFQEKKIPCLGVEPSSSTARIAMQRGIQTIEDFFTQQFVDQYLSQRKADLLLGNNVLAHVPDIRDFIAAASVAICHGEGGRYGYITFEFPHLLCLVQENQFDTIYHEHFSYLSLVAINPIFEDYGLKLFDVEKLSTHGGSLRVFLTHKDNPDLEVSPVVEATLEQERVFGLTNFACVQEFSQRCLQVKLNFLNFLVDAKKRGKKVVGYGAAAKGNTLLNYCGVKADLIDFVCDLSPHKQGRFLPGSHIRVVSPDCLVQARPDYIVIFPWNIKTEIMEQLAYVREWGGEFVTAIPSLEIF
ncbi:MAG: methyltransferase domain-containing protein [Spirochaetia bacterium]